MSQEKRIDDAVAAVRHFSRFYTRRLGLVGRRYLDSELSLTEGRVLFELNSRSAPNARDLCADLGLDPGYLSRILAGFERRGWLQMTPSRADRRQKAIEVTSAGRRLFVDLNRRSDREVRDLVAPLRALERGELVGALTRAEMLLDDRVRDASYRLRRHRVGDMGWVIEAHGRIYADEYGWGERFEALVAEIAGAFARGHDPERERCWIAERRGIRAGSVFVTRASDDVAKLRLLIVEPWARGLGIGDRFVREAILFAKAAGYRKMTLWTQQNLLAARRRYAANGFKLAHEEPYTGIGLPLVSETWERDL